MLISAFARRMLICRADADYFYARAMPRCRYFDAALSPPEHACAFTLMMRHAKMLMRVATPAPYAMLMLFSGYAAFSYAALLDGAAFTLLMRHACCFDAASMRYAEARSAPFSLRAALC